MQCTTCVWKLSLNFASKLHFKTPFWQSREFGLPPRPLEVKVIFYLELVSRLGLAIGGRRRLHGMGQKLFTMSKMFRSCHDIIMWTNVHPFCLYTSTSFHFANSASIPTDTSSKTPSFSSVFELLSLGLSIHLTYIGRSLNCSKSGRMRTICSAPRDETYKIW